MSYADRRRSGPQTVYFIQCVDTGHVKVGISRDPEKRLCELRRMTPNDLRLVATYEVGGARRDAMLVERRLHERYLAHHHRAEWFRECPEIHSDIASIRLGTFNPESLPFQTNASLFRVVSRHGRPRKQATSERVAA